MGTPYESLVARLGEEGARAEMRRRAANSNKPGQVSGFATMPKEQVRAMSLRGVAARNAKKDTTTSENSIKGQDSAKVSSKQTEEENRPVSSQA